MNPDPKVIMDGDGAKTSAAIMEKHKLPEQMADVYSKYGEFFIYLRNSRDDIVHRTKTVDNIFLTDRGFSVSSKHAPYVGYNWKEYQRYSDNMVSLRPWIGYIVFVTLQACTELVDALSYACKPPEMMFPGYRYLIRDPANPAVAALFKSQNNDVEVAKSQTFWA